MNSIVSPLGIAVHPHWRLPKLAQVEYLRRVFADWRITGIIDVGANEGQFARFVRSEVGFYGPILSVEPVPELALLLRNRSANNWRILEMAVGRTSGQATIHIAAGSQFSSLLEALDDKDGLFSGQTYTHQSATVRVDTLDSVIERYGEWLGDRIFLKLDTQGYDVEALGGLNDYLQRVVAAQCEASFVPIYQGAPLFAETIESFQHRGFTLSNIFPNNDGHYPRMIEVDCFFVQLPFSSPRSTVGLQRR